MQYFKGDAEEKKVVSVLAPILDLLSADKTAFFEQAYSTASLGEMVFDSQRTPLYNAIVRDIFRASFQQIFQAFGQAGTFESYILVFKKIFGDATSITFTVPGPGQLTIAIVASGFEISRFVARRIEGNAYIFEPVVTFGGDNIVFQTLKGFQSQYELEKMLYELVPAGVFTQISLTIGSP